MGSFYTMESVRDQIKGKYKCTPLDDLHDTWNRYPCRIEEICRTDHCTGFVSIELNLPLFPMSRIAVIFFKPKKIAVIRADNRQLMKMIDYNVIDKSKLEPILVKDI